MVLFYVDGESAAVPRFLCGQSRRAVFGSGAFAELERRADRESDEERRSVDVAQRRVEYRQRDERAEADAPEL